MKLKPYQITGAHFLAERRGALLADDMGLGKTAQAIHALRLAGLTRALVICPASLKLNWRDETRAWYPELEVGVAEGKRWPESDVVIANYDILGKHKDRIGAEPWPVIICDEAHYCKNPKAGRTKSVFRIPTARRWFLTGTPMLNRPKELWTLLRMIDPPKWRSFKDFVFRYCDPKFVMKQRGKYRVREFSTDGASNVEELRDLVAPYMLRRTKGEVLAELPDKTRQTILLPLIGAELKKAVKMERRLAQEKATGEVLGDLARLRKQIGMAKIPLAVEHVESLLEQEDKVVVFAHHRDVVAGLEAGLKKHGTVVLTGATPTAERHERVRRFQTDPATRVFVGNIQAAGVGLTLTAARVALFVEQDWGPKVMEQAEDRIHRIGQKNAALIQYLCYDGSLDAVMAATAARKEDIIQAVIQPRGVIMSIESILERIAVALETQCQQYDDLLKGGRIATPEKMAEKAAEAGAKARVEPTANPALDWDPKKEKIIGRYDANKRAVLEAEAARLGLTFDPKATGAQIHEMILNAVTEPSFDTPAPEETAASDDFDFDTPVTEPEKVYTPEEMRAILIEYCKAKGAKNAEPANKLISELFPGKSKLVDLTPAQYPKLVAAMKQ